MQIPHPLRSTAMVNWTDISGVDIWAMLKAAIDGDLEKIKTLVAKNPALVNCSYEYLPPIRFAVRENHKTVVEWLLANGANPIFDFGDSLLTIASDRGYTDLHTFLVEYLEKQYHINPEGDRLAEFMRSFDKNSVIEAIEKNPGLVHAADHRGNQPIHWAVLTRQLDMVEWLLKNGAEINAQRPDGARPLDLTNGDYFYRAWYRDLPPTGLQKSDILAGYLIARGAEYDMSVAAKMGHYERVKQLLDEDPALISKAPIHIGYYSGWPLRNAAAGGFIEIVKLLLDRGANPNQPETGISSRGAALHAAINRKQWEIVKLLLNHGADATAWLESSGNCLWMARHFGAPAEINDLLIAHGANLDVELLAYDGDTEGLQKLLEANPDLDINEDAHPTILENKAIMELVLRYQPEILLQFSMRAMHDPIQAKWLIDHGLDPDRRNWLGIAPLHRAAADGDIEVAAVYLDAGADINIIDEDYSSTPLGWAARHGKKEMVEFLLSKGADPSLPNDHPWAKPMEWAERRVFRDIKETLSKNG